MPILSRNQTFFSLRFNKNMTFKNCQRRGGGERGRHEKSPPEIKSFQVQKHQACFYGYFVDWGSEGTEALRTQIGGMLHPHPRPHKKKKTHKWSKINMSVLTHRHYQQSLCALFQTSGFPWLHSVSKKEIKTDLPHGTLLGVNIYITYIYIYNMWCVLPKLDTFGQEIKIELVTDNESTDLQLYNDSFLILIGRAKAGLCNF